MTAAAARASKLAVHLIGVENAPLVEKFGKLLPDHGAAAWADTLDRDAVKYVLAWKAPAADLRGLPNLEVIFSLGAGVDHIVTQDGLPDVPIVRFVDPDLTHRMTEYVVLNVLLHHRRVLDYQRLQREKSWDDTLPQPAARDIRVGILGMGKLGKDAAYVLNDLRFDVAGWSRSPKTIEGVTHYAGDAQFHDFLERTDILVNLLPLTPETRGLLNNDVFRRLAMDGPLPRPLPGPVLINAGRGGSQVEADILRALKDGTLWAASLDVFETEPLSKESPLWAHPRIVVTPHVAAVSSSDALSVYVARQIEAYESGAPLENVVSVDRGY